MRKVSMMVAVVFSVMLLASSVFAGQVITYPKAAPVFSIEFPDAWVVEIDEEDVTLYAMSSEEGEIELDIWPLDDEDVAEDVEAAILAAAEEIDEVLADYVTDVQLGDAEKLTINDVNFVEFAGTAKYIPEEGEKVSDEDLAVNISVAFFSPDGETVFVLLYWGTDEAEKAFAEDLGAILNSIHKP